VDALHRGLQLGHRQSIIADRRRIGHRQRERLESYTAEPVNERGERVAQQPGEAAIRRQAPVEALHETTRALDIS
jgi:hypothetical protein